MKKSVQDLGIAAYLMMHGFNVIGRKSRTIYFEVEEKDLGEFDRLSFEYLSGTHRQFDTSLMSLKKIGEYLPAGTYKAITDLGIAAYLLMHGFRVAGRKGRIVYFDVAAEDGDEFERLNFEYLSTTYHQFDSCLMLLKKVGEYTPPDIAE
jgi:hypothetical protein